MRQNALKNVTTNIRAFFCPGSQCEENDDCFSGECNVDKAVCLGDVPEEIEITCIERSDYADFINAL